MYSFPSLPGGALVAGLAAISASGAGAQGPVYESDEHRFRVVTVVDGLEHPWGMAFLPNGDMLVTERPGRLRIVRDGRLDPRPITGTPEVAAFGQGGMLDVAVHPDFEANRWVYVSYSKPGRLRSATTAVIRGRLAGDRLTDVVEIIEADAWTRRGQHFGSRLAFDGAGYLYVTVGDRGVMEEAQDRSNHQGTVLRLRDDGGVPDDNPFVGRPGIRPEIFTWGNRSPQGLTVHPVTGQLWESEHGPRGGDEINVLEPGANYGWPVITYGINYNGRPISDLTEKAGMMQPVHYWVPSIATSGIAVYSGSAFPRWSGNVFVGGLAGQQLARVVVSGGRSVHVEPLLQEWGRRIRDVRVGPDGYLYLLVDQASAPMVRLEPVR